MDTDKIIIMIIAFAIIGTVFNKMFIFMVVFIMPLISLTMGIHTINNAKLMAVIIMQFISIMGIIISQEDKLNVAAMPSQIGIIND